MGWDDSANGKDNRKWLGTLAIIPSISGAPLIGEIMDSIVIAVVSIFAT
jgi:hypothetical protein